MNPNPGTGFLVHPAAPAHATGEGMDPLAALALMNDWVNDEQVADAERLCRKFAEEGIRMSVGEALEKKGYLTKIQIEELQRRSKAAQMAQAIPGYELIKKLGQGGMGSVYKAIQKAASRPVAIKILSPQRAKTPDFVERFIREARASARVNHPHIIQGIDVGQANGIHYFVMEYVEGGTLREKLKQRGRINEAETLQIALQMAGALEAINKAGMVHRDIKPENILCCTDGTFKLCDLGLSRLMDEDASLTRSDVALGTPLYISPEQAQAKNNFDSRTDMYGLGATLYHLLTGRPPFSGETSTAVMTAHVLEEAVHPRLLTPDASAGFVAILRVMMAKQMKERYPTPAALIQDLENLRKGRTPEYAMKFTGKSSIPSVSTGALPPMPVTKAQAEPLLPPLDGSGYPRPSARAGSAIRTKESNTRPPTPPTVPIVAGNRMYDPEPITIDTPLPIPVVKSRPPTNPSVAPVLAPVIALGPIPPRVIGSASKDRAVSNPQSPNPTPSNPQLPTTSPAVQPATPPGAYGRMIQAPPPAAPPAANQHAPVEQFLPPAAFVGMAQGVVGASAMTAPMPPQGSAPRPHTQVNIPPSSPGAAPVSIPPKPAAMDDQLNALLATKTGGFPVLPPPPPPPEPKTQPAMHRPPPVDDQLNALLSTKTSGFPVMPAQTTATAPAPAPVPLQNANATVAPAARTAPTATPNVIIPTPLPGSVAAVPQRLAPAPVLGQPAPGPYVPPPPAPAPFTPVASAPSPALSAILNQPAPAQPAQAPLFVPPPPPSQVMPALAAQQPLFVAPPPAPAAAPAPAQQPLFSPPPTAAAAPAPMVGLNLSDLSAEPAPAGELPPNVVVPPDAAAAPAKSGGSRTLILAIAAMLFIGVLVVGVGGYYGYQYYKKRKAGASTEVANLDPTNAPPVLTPDGKVPEIPKLPGELNKTVDEAKALAEKQAEEAKQAALAAQKKLEDEKAAAEKKLQDEAAQAAKLADEKKAQEAAQAAQKKLDEEKATALAAQKKLEDEKAAAEKKLQEEKELAAKLAEEKKAQEAAMMAKLEADRKAEADRLVLAKEEAERKAREAAELLAKEEEKKKAALATQSAEPVPPANTQAAVDASKTAEPVKVVEPVKTAEPVKPVETAQAPTATQVTAPPANTTTAPATTTTAPASTATADPTPVPQDTDSREAAFKRALEQAASLLNGETPDAKGVYTMLTPDKQRQVMAEILKAWQIKPNHPTAREMWLKLGWRKWDGTEKVADYAKAVRLPAVINLDVGDGVMLEANLIPAAMFTMGSPENETGRLAGENQHLVHLSKPIYMGKYEVTQEIYEKVMGAAANKSSFKGPKNPEDRVSWADAEAFCKAATAKLKRPVRLPTEAEWEFACRAGSTTIFNFGDSLTADKANFYGKSPVNGERGEYRAKSVPVGTFQPNGFGLFDMHGNCWEWVSDWRADYSVEPVVDPVGPEKGKIKVLRGGSWYSKGNSCRSANRDGDSPADAGNHYGFRVVVELSK